MSERLYLIDAGALGAWKHFSVGDASEHADAVEGVNFWLADFMQHYSPARAVACFDCSRATNWRKLRYVEYKSRRDALPTDEAFRAAMKELPRAFEAVGMPIARADGMEADDVIATLSGRHDGEVVIFTSDKDLHQLVDDRVSVFDPRPDKAGVCVFYDMAKVMEKHHVPPHRLREKLAIKGDSADSIPGVKGLGDVFAVTAIKQTRSRMELERRLLAGELADITPKNQKLFAEKYDDYRLSYELVGLRFDAPIAEDFDTAIRSAEHVAA